MPKIFKTKVEKCGEMIVLAYCQEFSREDEKNMMKYLCWIIV